MIPNELLTDFIEEPYWQIKQYNVFNNKYRIDVWQRIKHPDRLVPQVYIDRSYFMSYTQDDGLKDLTKGHIVKVDW